MDLFIYLPGLELAWTMTNLWLIFYWSEENISKSDVCLLENLKENASKKTARKYRRKEKNEVK